MEGYNIKIGVDSRSAERGVRSFTSALTDSLKRLRDFDQKAKDTFKALDQFSKLNAGNLTRTVKGVTAAVDALNKVRVSKALVNNLQTLQKTLQGIRFSGNKSLAAMPAAFKALEAIKINPNLATSLNTLKASLKGFTSPSKGLTNWPKTINALGRAKLSAALPRQLEALKLSMRGFTGPTKSAQALPVFLKELSKHKLSPALANNLSRLKASMAGFQGISARVGPNLASLFQAIRTANPAQINAVAAALMRLNGLNINIGRTLSRIGSAGRGINSTTSSVRGLESSMRSLYQTTHTVQNAFHLLQAALGGVTLGSFVKGVYETGNAYISLQRTLAAVASSQDEVGNHLAFIQGLTQKMPISIEAATESYRKFAVAARLSGLTVEETQGIFEDFSVGFSAMGLSVDSQKFAFIALEQMISKGNITMEELKTQLGDHLPGAVQILANALDVPVAKLFKMIEAGEVTADALIKMGKDVRETFGAAAEAARNSSQGQFVELGNAWTEFKKQIFNNDFNAALGALANTLSEVLRTDDMKNFAAAIGQAFGRAFKALAALARLLADNRDLVLDFMKAFAAYGAIGAAAAAVRMLLIPMQGLSVLLGPVAMGFRGLYTVMKLMAAGQVLTAIKTFFSFFTRNLVIAVAGVAALGGAVYMLSGYLDALAGTNTQGALKGFAEGSLQFAKDVMTGISGLGDGLFAEIDRSVDASSESFDDMMKKITESDAAYAANAAKNAEREKKQLDAKEKQLNAGEQKLWDQLNPIGKATEEYERQVKLLDEIAKKRGLSDSQKAGFRRILDEQSFADRNPLGAELRDMGIEVEELKAKTGAQEAVNKAKAFELSMLAKGVALTEEQKTAALDYYQAIAKMNGEMGNGIERWTTQVGDFTDELHKAVSDGIGSLTDELSDFLSGAEADFGKLAQSILKSFIKISLDSLLKDAFKAMGMDGEQNGADAANAALAKIASIGDVINTQKAEIYAADVSLNGKSLTEAFEDTPLRGPLDTTAANPAAATKTPAESLKTVQDTALRGAHSQTNTEQLLDRNPRMTEDAAALKFRKQAEEGAAAGDQTAIKWLRDNPLPAAAIDPMTTGALSQAMPPAAALGTGKTISLSPKEIGDLKKVVATEWVTSAGEMQGKGIIDTILNRKASGHWGSTVTDVVNARAQFSDVNSILTDKKGRNSVDELMIGRDIGRAKYARSSELVDNWLAQRGAGAESVIGDNLNYANPYYSTKNNLGWINALDGPTFGRGKAIHRHGTTAGLQKYRPGAFQLDYSDPSRIPQETVPPGLDTMSTGSIDKATASLQQLGTAAQQVGTTTQTASQQVQMANQTKTTSEQMSSMATQQAGMNAQMSAPQFQQAGQSIAAAGQAAGQGAQAAQASLGQLSSLVGMIPGAGPYAGIFSQLLGMFKEGGIATQPVAFSKLPHFAEGTANTGGFGKGGIPSVLHPNEAVIPLSRGRTVPVEINSTNENESGKDSFSRRQAAGASKLELHLHGVKNGDDFKRSRRQIQASMAGAVQRSSERMN